MADKKEQKVILLPVGRLVNGSLFERDIYVDQATGKEGKPSYKIEMAYDEAALQSLGDPKDPHSIYDELQWAAEEKWGNVTLDVDAKSRDEEAVITPVLNGDKLAKRREDKGKKGDAYKGKLIIRASTQFNKHGEDGPGGIPVYLEDRSEATIANQSAVYNGSMGILAVTIGTYIDPKTQDKGLKFWLVAYQKTGDGERLMSSRDTSSLFQAVGKAPGGDAPAARKRRAA